MLCEISHFQMFLIQMKKQYCVTKKNSSEEDSRTGLGVPDLPFRIQANFLVLQLRKQTPSHSKMLQTPYQGLYITLNT